MNSVVMDVVRIGLAAWLFRLVLIWLTSVFPIPGLHQLAVA
jgi:hypothetical protein